MAERIRLQRTKGWRKPKGAVVVARPTKWGNPYIIHNSRNALLGGCEEHDYDCVYDAATAVLKFRHAVLWPVVGQPRVPTPDYIRQELADKDLACWCPLDQPCHADVLLEIAKWIRLEWVRHLRQARA